MTTRRGVIIGTSGLLAAVVAGLYRFTDLFVKHYPPTPFDDVLVQLVDRAQAVRVGKQVRSGDLVIENFDDRLAKKIRQRLSGADMTTVTEKDIATGKMIEIDGWQMPMTLVMTCLLAAHVTPDQSS